MGELRAGHRSFAIHPTYQVIARLSAAAAKSNDVPLVAGAKCGSFDGGSFGALAVVRNVKLIWISGPRWKHMMSMIDI